MRRSVKLSLRWCDKKIGDIQWKRLSLRTKRPFRRAGTSFVSIHVKTRTKRGLIKELGQRQKAENSWFDVQLKTMFCILGAFVFIDISSPIGRFSETRNQNGIIVMSTSIPLILLGIDKKHSFHVINPLTAEWALRALIDFTLSNARRFYSSKGNPLDEKGLTTSKTMSRLNNSSDLRVLFVSVERSELSYTDWL